MKNSLDARKSFMKIKQIPLFIFLIAFYSVILQGFSFPRNAERNEKYSTFNGLNLKLKKEQKEILGTYSEPPRMENGRVDIEKLIKELKDIHANTYNWLIWKKNTDWEDLQLFLSFAKKKKIQVWVTIVPPSESKPNALYSSEPFGLDYERWAKEIATLSIKYSSLVAWSIDDFVHNLDFYTSGYVETFTRMAKEINPELKFIPCCYYKQTTPVFVNKYSPYLDGILFPYRSESVGANLKDPSKVRYEIEQIRRLFSPGFPVILDVYATAHSRLGDSTPQYVKDVLDAGRTYADGVLIFCHQDPEKSAEKYRIIKEGFK